jgi:type I thyroxine 5'-deiodinase
MEAHPVDAWQDEDNLKDKISVSSPKTLEQRCSVAETCLTKLTLKIPPLVDDLANSTEAAYTAWPDRIYVLDREGNIAYKSLPGPYGFKPAEMANVLKRVLPGPSAQLR